jgi:response regulator RpfG family c-di-GMP phosphodiesterase
MPAQSVLLVDDEPLVLSGLIRHVRKHVQVEQATSAQEAMSKLEAEAGKFGVVVSDYQMPEIDGIELLQRVTNRFPDVTRIMLTGQGDLNVATQAVNRGSVFRFLTKPCEPEALVSTIQAGLRQHELVTAERELLQKTLTGSIKVLTDVLSLSNPRAFGRASRAYRLARSLAPAASPEDRWQVSMAAMLSQLGCLTVSSDLLDRAESARELTEDDRTTLDAQATMAADLVANIPRLERVAETIRWQNAPFEEREARTQRPSGFALPLGARILHVALDFNRLRLAGLSPTQAVDAMRQSKGEYDPDVIDQLAAVLSVQPSSDFRKVTLQELRAGMTFAEPVYAKSGALLIGHGQDVTDSVRALLRSFIRRGEAEEPFAVHCPREPETDCHDR